MQSINVSRYLLPALAVFAMFFILGEAYPNGAPLAACAGAQPIHTTNGSPVQPLNPANNPYSFTLEVEEYIPGQDLEVTINGGMVNGFFLQARRTDTGVPVGTFQDPLPTGAQLRQCTNAADSVTHTNPNGKTALTFTWRAPAAGVGEVEFVGAVCLDHDNFYGGMKSAVLAEGNAQSLACQILSHSNVYLLDNNGYLNSAGNNDGADAYSNIADTCNGNSAKRSSYCCSSGCSPGGYVSLKASVLQYILDVANAGNYNSYLQINAIAGACHSSNSWHYQGTAVDFQIKSGDNYSSWMSMCSSYGARENLGPGYPGHSTHTHCAFSS